jgi:hypothetical protein
MKNASEQVCPLAPNNLVALPRRLLNDSTLTGLAGAAYSSLVSGQQFVVTDYRLPKGSTG